MPPSVITLIDSSVPVMRPDQPEHQRRDHQRQRNGRERDERRAEVEQEQKQDDDDQHGPDDEGLLDVVNAAVDEAFELEQVGVDDDVGGQRRLRTRAGPPSPRR